jgi:hypothetical protein
MVLPKRISFPSTLNRKIEEEKKKKKRRRNMYFQADRQEEKHISREDVKVYNERQEKKIYRNLIMLAKRWELANTDE